MNFWSQSKNKSEIAPAMPTGKLLKVIVPMILAVFVLVTYLSCNPVVLSIRYNEDAYDNYVEERTYGCSFYSTESGTFYTTHGIDAFDIEVNYLFAPSEDLWEAFDNGNITIEDLDRLDFDYWFQAKRGS